MAAITMIDSAGEAVIPLRPPGQFMGDPEQVPKLLRFLSHNSQVRRLVVKTADGRTFPVVAYKLSPPTSTVAGVVTDPSNHLTLVPSGHPR